MAAHLAHYQETTFESFGCNQRSVGVSPFSKMPDSVNTDFVGLNYHRRVLKLALQWIYLGMWQERAANALPKKAK